MEARLVKKEVDYLATIDALDLTGSGATAEEAQDDLVNKFMSWVQTFDGRGTLEAQLAEAGYSGVNEDTELELRFEE